VQNLKKFFFEKIEKERSHVVLSLCPYRRENSGIKLD